MKIYSMEFDISYIVQQQINHRFINKDEGFLK
jgi:hypothetical protein